MALLANQTLCPLRALHGSSQPHGPSDGGADVSKEEDLAPAFGNPNCSLNSLGKPERVDRPLWIPIWGD